MYAYEQWVYIGKCKHCEAPGYCIDGQSVVFKNSAPDCLCELDTEDIES